MIHLVYAYFGKKFCERMALRGITIHDTRAGDVNIPADDDVVIRWGSPHPIETNSWVRNFKYNILESSNKPSARIKMQNAGLPVPRTRTDAADVVLPVIARPELHSQGSGFHVCRTKRKLNDAVRAGCVYFSSIFKHDREYRVHVASGKVLYIQDKNVNPRQRLRGDFPNEVPWTIIEWDDYNKDMCLNACKAVDMFELHFGAVDIMYNSKTKAMAICEVNTAPEVGSDMQREKYFQYFNWLNITRADNQKWDHSKFKTGREFAWTHKQLQSAIPKDARQ